MKFKCTFCSKQGNFWLNLEKLCVAKCGHAFHLNCLMAQIRSQSKTIIECPMSTCNKKIKQTTIIQIDPLVTEERKRNKMKNRPIDCILCNDAVKDLKNISVTKCGHIHHSECLVKFVGRQSDECLAPKCKKKITLATITKIHLVQGKNDVMEPNQNVTAEDLRWALLDDDENSFKNKNELSMDAPCTSKKVTQSRLTFTQKCCKEKKKSDEKPETAAGELLSPLPKNKKKFCELNSDQLCEQIKRGLDMLDKDGKLQIQNAFSQIANKQVVVLQKRNEELELQVETLEKDRNDAKKETAIWEMSFKYLQDKFEDTTLMIPNDETLHLIQENEKLKLDTQEMEKERNDAKKESKIWEMSFTYLQDTFKGTDIMIPNEATLKLIKDNEDLKFCIQDLGRKLVSTKEDMASANSLRADFENSVEENLNLKTEFEELKRELSTEKENMIKANSTITDLVMRHSQENDNLIELNHSVLIENTRLSEANKTLQKENSKLNERDHSLLNEITRLKEWNETLQKENNQMKERNETLQKEDNVLKERNDTLQKENRKLNAPNHSLLNEITRLKERNETLLNENSKLNEPDQSLLNEITTLKERNENLQKENSKINELALSLQKEKREREERDFQWEFITRRRTVGDSQATNKRRASEMCETATEKHATEDLGNKSVTETIVKKEGAKEEVVNEEINLKRIKVEENDTEDTANMSSATEINQAISRLHYSLKME